MNLLAHFFLSGTENHSLTLGNFSGDFVKGKKYLQYPPEVKKGILLHRQIDSFTDHHPQVINSKRRLYSRYHHYSAVLVDLYYDYILAGNFGEYSSQSLPDFANAVYAILYKNKEVLPDRAQYILPYMSRDNWLVHYGTLEGISRACKGIASRSPYASGIATGAEELEKYLPFFEDEFRLFFPQMQQHVKEWLAAYGEE